MLTIKNIEKLISQSVTIDSLSISVANVDTNDSYYSIFIMTNATISHRVIPLICVIDRELCNLKISAHRFCHIPYTFLKSPDRLLLFIHTSLRAANLI